ncbi:hypothetical protein HKBW3S43_01692 [Candidatus Hakubella thermalkaliphila]|uniref:HTH cro/C1-type domain-containing protein n=1 Tax=Candidatus Hakubella thermalkaliphila TaxID=2754717 RepID=A0A6V8PAA3_9ACTN|nr:helix-turn-helix transcriptional regulator [Candidatus Hakubella thermalkaliphila]GFP24711.1 hypothetical protein HKBW3S25_00148 [Candidatus Hakubella thermalkaliphila]GFP28594.1 hypothetical protein HKBW3S33_02008 [Candidatus Hakubella thermalkaliphila]GFP35905.1 hypothetical protein HKBW3S43_01692 [Candidatus Hakubella thermalkaliphila]GFP43712.1 hypothetical protein HKBW3C_02841 [Candidatus Hakubella thermalkaliphila]
MPRIKRPPNLVSRNLRYLRSQLGLNYSEMSRIMEKKKRIELSPVQIRNIEMKENRHVRVDTLAKIADYFELSYDALIRHDLSQEIEVENEASKLSQKITELLGPENAAELFKTTINLIRSGIKVKELVLFAETATALRNRKLSTDQKGGERGLDQVF